MTRWALGSILLVAVGCSRSGFDRDPCEGGRCCNFAQDCDDQNPCTDEACSEQHLCVFAFNSAPCDDGDTCSSLDVCALGTCVGGASDRDRDGDGYIDAQCPGGDDCDDDPALTACGATCHPDNGSPDLCDGYDQDCDGEIDEQGPSCTDVALVGSLTASKVSQDAFSRACP